MLGNALLLDAGNSRCKYQYANEVGTLDAVPALEALLDRFKPDWVFVASVSQLGQELMAYLKTQAIPMCCVKVVRQWQSLVVAYENPALLGVDRWLAMVAATGSEVPVVTVDLGTAITLDALAVGGQHLGGYIVPGLNTMRSCLVEKTLALPKVAGLGSLQPGNGTQAAMANGTLVSVVAFIEKAISSFGLNSPQVWLTGGDAEHIQPFLRLPSVLVQSLVFDGMKRLIKDAVYMRQLA